MPKALLIRRPDGLYARFKLPADIRAQMGQIFLVRSLRGQRGDAARLTAARLGYALGETIERVRKGGPDMDAKKAIEAALAAAAAAAGRTRDYTLDIPGVVSLRADGEQDHRRAMEALASLRDSLARTPAPPAQQSLSAGPLLRASADKFLEHCRQVN